MKETTCYVHPSAIVETAHIGSGTRVWAFSHIMPDARIGRDCNIGEHCFIESGVSIGDATVIKNGVALWSGVEIGSMVFVGPNAVFTNDLMPRAKQFRPTTATRVLHGASIGANATIRCGIKIGQWAMIGAGSVVTADVPDYALVYGNPARVHGRVCECGARVDGRLEVQKVCECGKAMQVAEEAL